MRYFGGEIWSGFWKMDGLLKVDTGQIDISCRRNISWFLYSKYILKNSLPCNTFWPGLSKFSLEKKGYGQSKDVEVGVLKTLWMSKGGDGLIRVLQNLFIVIWTWFIHSSLISLPYRVPSSCILLQLHFLWLLVHTNNFYILWTL